ncbi:MAG: hypothetical protein ABIO67_09615, partial [Mycobacteriales bacterium]
MGARAVALATSLLVMLSIATMYVMDARLTRVGRPDLHQLTGAGPLFLTAMVASAGVGGALLIAQPRHPVGWCFAGLGSTIALAGVAQSYGVYGVLARPGTLVGAQAAATLASSLYIFWLVFLALACSLTPTGRHLSARWRRASWVMVAAAFLWFLSIVVSPGQLQDPFQRVDNAWGVEGLPWLGPTRTISGTVNNLLVLAAIASLVVRFHRSVGDERRQLLWMAVFVVPLPLLLTVTYVASKTDHDAVLNVAAGAMVTLLPLGAGLSVSRYHLYDVDRILSRALS